MLDLTAEQKRRRWLALGIVALAYVLSFFQRFAPAGIAQDLAVSFSTSAASLGALAATYFYVYTLMQIPTSPTRSGRAGSWRSAASSAASAASCSDSPRRSTGRWPGAR